MTLDRKTIFKFVLALVTVAAVSMLANLFTCNTPVPVTQSEVIRITDTIPGDASPVVSKEYYPVPVPGKTVFDTVFREVDTLAIMHDYFARKFYSDTLTNDSSMFIVVNDSISRNRIISRKYLTQNRRPVAYSTTVFKTETANSMPNESRFNLFGGAFGGYSVKNKTFSIGPEISVLYEGFLVGYGYDIPGNGHYANVSLKLTGRGRKWK